MTCTLDARRAGLWVDALGHHGARALMADAEGAWRVLPEAPSMPVARFAPPDAGGESYLFRPSVLYGAYALHETERHAAAWMARAMGWGQPALRGVLRATGWDNHHQINAWGVSTQLVGDADAVSVAALVPRLLGEAGGGSVLLRSVCPVLSPALAALAGARVLSTRQVWIWRTPPSRRKRPDFWADQKLLAEGAWTWKEGACWLAEDFARAKVLYDDLYRTKHTPLNPAYTELCLRVFRDAGIVRFWGLVPPEGGPLAGFLGMIERDGVLTTPFLGVDGGRPQNDAVYRRLVARSFQEALAEGGVLHMSAGAARFKELRGAVPEMELALVWEPPRSGVRARLARAAVGASLRASTPYVMRSRF